MKQIVCEVCGATSFLKKDDKYICQECSMEYDLSSIKGMMKETGDSPENGSSKTATNTDSREENLYTLALNSYNSGNYQAAENFCNEILTINTKNAAVWELKAGAVFYQITAANPRFDEVENCYTNMFSLLSEEDRQKNRDKYIDKLVSTCKEYTTFWANYFANLTPSQDTFNSVKLIGNRCVLFLNHTLFFFNVKDIVDGGNKNVIDSDFIKNLANEVRNYFIEEMCAACELTWKNNVASNYYQDAQYDYGLHWRTETYCYNTDAYRPMEAQFKQFLIESEVIITFLDSMKFYYNEHTATETMDNVVKIAKQIIECMATAHSYKISSHQGLFDEFSRICWVEEYSYTDEGVNGLYKILDGIKKGVSDEKKKRKEKIKAEKKQKEKEEKERQNSEIDAFWSCDTAKRDELKKREKALKKEEKELKSLIKAKIDETEAFINQYNQPMNSESRYSALCDECTKIHRDIHLKNLFGGKKKKALGDELSQKQQQLELIEADLQKESDAYNSKFKQKVSDLCSEIKGYEKKLYDTTSSLKDVSDTLRCVGKIEGVVSLYNTPEIKKESLRMQNFADEKLSDNNVSKNTQQKQNSYKDSLDRNLTFEKIIKVGICVSVAAILLIVLAILNASLFKPLGAYNKAVDQMNEENYVEAIVIFTELDGFKDSEEQIINCKDALFNKAQAYVKEKKHSQAFEIFEYLGEYKDSDDCITQIKEDIKEERYNTALQLLNDGEYYNAALSFKKLEDYSDSQVQHRLAMTALSNQGYIDAGVYFTLGLNNDGTVNAVGMNNDKQCNVNDFEDVAAVSGAYAHSAVLTEDGKVKAVGDKSYGQTKVSDWKDIVQISTGNFHTVGLKSDGTVVATKITKKSGNSKQSDVKSWSDITAISCGAFHTLGLKSDGTVVATGNEEQGRCDVETWKNVIAVRGGGFHSVALTESGTVLATGYNDYGQCDVSDWENIVAIDAGYNFTAGLTADGKVLIAGQSIASYSDIQDLTDIIAIYCGGVHLIAVDSKGKLHTLGDNSLSQCDLDSFDNIRFYSELE